MKYISIACIAVLIFSCTPNQLSEDFNCENSNFSSLKKMDDFKKVFSIKLPKHWNTKLYYDDGVSSIYSADTTQSLTKAILLDATFILNTNEIDSKFIDKVKADNLSLELKELNSKKISFLNNDGYYNLATGKKGKYTYHLLNVYSKTTTGFLHIKTEIYGDSLVDQRICDAVKLIENIRLK